MSIALPTPGSAGRLFGLAGLAAGLALATAAVVQGQTRTRVTPYLEYQQVLNADFNSGDVLTYAALGAGIDGTITTRRVQATISYNYQRRIALDGDLGDDDVHSGLAAAQLQVVPGTLTFDAGALATRSQGSAAVPVPGFRTADDPNLVDVYSVYAGPTLSARAGGLDIGASYRLAYVHIDDDSLSGGDVPGGRARLASAGSSTVHSAQVSVGQGPGELPFGWTVGAAYAREDAGPFDSTNEAKFIRGDIVLPVSHSLALTAGVGYEDLRASQQDVLRDENGLPVFTSNGELIPDPTRPRLRSYDQSGIIWDAGLLYRPSRHTDIAARVGRRYGGTSVTGSLSHRLSRHYSVSASVYDSVSSFGRLLVADLEGVPRDFQLRRNPISGGLGGVGGCVYGAAPGSGACFDDALQSINSATFRTRGASIGASGKRGLWSFDAGLGYSQRRYFIQPDGSVLALDHVTDRGLTASAGAGRRLSRTSGINGDIFAGWFDSELGGSSYSTGATASYYRTIFRDRIQANVAAGLYSVDAGSYDSTVGSVLFGLRYNF